MKKRRFLLTLCLYLLFITLIIGCGGGANGDIKYRLRVWGDSGVVFSGTYTVVTSEGQSTTYDVDSITPDYFDVQGSKISCSFETPPQWTGRFGKLRVDLFRLTDK